jgi:hypothetical protein
VFSQEGTTANALREEEHTMTTRQSAPPGAPCWADLWTSDVDGSRAFYAELFGWTAEEPSPEFGGYFMFTRNGVPMCGGMGDMDDMPADNTWKIYLSTPDIDTVVQTTAAEGGQVMFPPMPIADLGIQTVITDATGAVVGAWQPGTFPGFTVLEEDGTPDWFELFTRDQAKSLAFYGSVFGWTIDVVGDTDEFRYAVMRDTEANGQLAGVMDAHAFLPHGVPDHWSIYFHVANVDASTATVQRLGGSIVAGPDDTPYGRIATATDPAGAQFKLRGPNIA